MVAHSILPNNKEIITLEIELHRFILPEFNTHRTFSRNFQSSRAVPVKKLIEQVRNDPAIPVHWGKNQAGMVADGECNKYVHTEEVHGVDRLAEDVWKISANEAADLAEDFNKAGYHKQIVNRLLEPFMWTKGVVTASKEAFEAFFTLRSHKDAQPEIKALSDVMMEVIEGSIGRQLTYGEYHLPYYDREEKLPIEQAIKISTSSCAQVSYRTLDTSLEKAIKIYDMLNLPENGKYKEDPPHFSPTEHVFKVITNHTEGNPLSGNLNTPYVWQYRKALEEGLEGEFRA